MPTAVPFPNGVHDLLLIVVVAVGATVAGAIAAGSILPGAKTPVASAAVVAASPETPAAPVSHPGTSLCRCPAPARLNSADAPGHTRRDNPPPAMPRALDTRAEAGSYAAWQRAETDARRILARLAALSRNTPPSRTTDPGSGFGAPGIL